MPNFEDIALCGRYPAPYPLMGGKIDVKLPEVLGMFVQNIT